MRPACRLRYAAVPLPQTRTLRSRQVHPGVFSDKNPEGRRAAGGWGSATDMPTPPSADSEGTVKRNRLPLPGSLSARMRPTIRSKSLARTGRPATGAAASATRRSVRLPEALHDDLLLDYRNAEACARDGEMQALASVLSGFPRAPLRTDPASNLPFSFTMEAPRPPAHGSSTSTSSTSIGASPAARVRTDLASLNLSASAIGCSRICRSLDRRTHRSRRESRSRRLTGDLFVTSPATGS